jgi:hypothetical protein
MRSLDHCMMRSGETKDAMGARRATRSLRRLFCGAAGIVEAEFEPGPAVIGLSGEGEAPERNQQTLRGDGVGEDDADQRAQNTCWAKSHNCETHVAKLAPAPAVHSMAHRFSTISRDERPRLWHFCYTAFSQRLPTLSLRNPAGI